MRARQLIVLVFAVGCISQATSMISPTPTGSGTLTCREIVETCDSQCQSPFCVRECGDRGTAVAAQQHGTLVDCAQRFGCTDEGCIRASCPAESEACEGAPAADR